MLSTVVLHRGNPGRTSQTRAVWSELAVTTREPSGLNAAAVIARA